MNRPEDSGELGLGPACSRRGPIPGRSNASSQDPERDFRRRKGQALLCRALQSARDAVWDLLLLPTHVYFSLRLISIIMRVYTKSRERRKAKPKSAVQADGGGSYDKH